jgi:hypothetical protein
MVQGSNPSTEKIFFFSKTVQTRSGAKPDPIQYMLGFFLAYSSWGMQLTPHLHLVLR